MSDVLTVGKLMSPPSLCLSPETSVRDAERRLGESRVTGAPVVDESGHAVGVISQHDLIVHLAGMTTSGEAGHFFTDVDDYRELAAVPADRSVTPVSEIMTRDVVCVDRSTSVVEAAVLMRSKRIHRLLVTDSGVLVGLVSSLDLLAAVEALA